MFFPNVMVNLKNPLTAFTTPITLHKLSECGRGWGGEGGGQRVGSLPLFVINNKNKFKLNSDVPHIHTRQKCYFHPPSSIYHYINKESVQFAQNICKSPTKYKKFK